jgi:O-antigen/teichoic acid export membrane protein
MSECLWDKELVANLRNLLKPEGISLGAKVTRNVIYNAARTILLAPLPFFLIPYFLKKLGSAGYGTWAVFLAINGMTSLADFGLVTSISKHVAQYYALRDYGALGRLISTGLVLYLGIAFTVAGALWATSHLLVATLFRNSAVPGAELAELWKYLIFLVFANILTLLFSSIVVGLQRMDLSNGMNSLNLLLSAGLSVTLLHQNLALRGIIYGYTVGAWTVTLVYAYLVWRLLPEVRVAASSCRWPVAREILSFSVQAYVTQVAVAIHNQIEKFYLARFVGVVPVGWYDISSDLALKLRGIPSLVLTPLMPAASELDAHGNYEKLMNLYFRAHKYLAFVGVPIMIFVVLVSKSFVSLWVGPSLSLIALPLCFLVVVNFFNLASGPGFLILIGQGKLRPGLNSAVLGIVLNLTISFLLIHLYGFQGAVIGTSLSISIATAYFLYEFQRETKSSLLELARIAYRKPLFASLVSGAVLLISSEVVRVSWVTLFLGALVFGLIYAVFLLFLRFFDSVDLAIADRIVRVPSFVRRIIPNAELGSPLLANRKSAQATSE